MEENGVWRTVGGRRIFIKEGQDLASAMKESGKFGNVKKNDKDKIVEENLYKQIFEDETIKYEFEMYSAEQIRKSNVFDRNIDDVINKVAFDNDYEITIDKVKEIKDSFYKEYDKRRNQYLTKSNYSEIETLKNDISALDKEIQETKVKLAENAKYAMPSDKEYSKEKEEYYSYRKKYTNLQNEYNKKLDELSKKNKEENKTSKTFVNSYGEATKREITSSTYKRSQKNLEKQIANFLK